MDTLGKKKTGKSRTATMRENGDRQVEVCSSDDVSARSEGDRRWDALFASTTDEEFLKLKRALAEEEDGEDTPLDFVDK